MSHGLSQEEIATIQGMMDEALDALAGTDVDAWLAWWTEDGEIMAPGQPSHTGHAGLRELFPRIGGQRTVLSNVRIEGCDDLAVVTTDLDIPRPEGGTDPAKQILKLRRQPDGRWLCAACIFNYNVPIVF